MLRPGSALLISLLSACGLPRDADGASERLARTHELRVGFTDNPPWVEGSGAQPRGIEPDLVRRFASLIGARITWTRGSETRLADALEQREIDIALGGFDAKTKWKTQAGVTRPFVTTADKKKHVLLTAAGENALLLRLDRFMAEQSEPAGVNGS